MYVLFHHLNTRIQNGSPQLPTEAMTNYGFHAGSCWLNHSILLLELVCSELGTEVRRTLGEKNIGRVSHYRPKPIEPSGKLPRDWDPLVSKQRQHQSDNIIEKPSDMKTNELHTGAASMPPPTRRVVAW